MDTSASGEQAEFEDDRKKGEYGSDDSAVNGKHTASQMGTDSEEDDQAKGLRIAAEAAGGLSSNTDFGEGSASSKSAKKISKERRRPKRRIHEQQKASKIHRIGAQLRGSAITDPRQWLITANKSPFLAIQRPYREVTTATCGLECHKRPP